MWQRYICGSGPKFCMPTIEHEYRRQEAGGRGCPRFRASPRSPSWIWWAARILWPQTPWRTSWPRQRRLAWRFFYFLFLLCIPAFSFFFFFRVINIERSWCGAHTPLSYESPSFPLGSVDLNWLPQKRASWCLDERSRITCTRRITARHFRVSQICALSFETSLSRLIFPGTSPRNIICTHADSPNKLDGKRFQVSYGNVLPLIIKTT